MIVIAIIILYLLIGRLSFIIHDKAVDIYDDGVLYAACFFWPIALVVWVVIGIIALGMAFFSWDWSMFVDAWRALKEAFKWKQNESGS